MRSNENPITTPVLLKLSHGSCWWNPNCVPWSGHLPIPMMYSFVSLVVSNHMWDDDRQWPIFIFQWVEANNQFIELLLTLAAVFLDENLRVIRFVLPFQDLRFVNKGTVLSYLIIISFIENTLQQHGIYHDMIYHDIYIYILPHSGQPHSPTGLTILAHFDHWWAGDIELSGSPPSPYSFQICVCPQIKHPKISDRIIFTMCENNHFPKFETKLFIIFPNLMVRIRL